MDMRIKKCSKCGISKEVCRNGKRDHKKYVYIDNTGRRWAGLTCPDCCNKRFHKTKSTKVCRQCTNTFITANHLYRYCSKSCYHKYYANYYKKPLKIREGVKQCRICDKAFRYTIRGQGSIPTCCSNTCKNRLSKHKGNYKPFLNKNCMHCNIQFSSNRAVKRFCSRICSRKYMRQRVPKKPYTRTVERRAYDKIRKRALERRVKDHIPQWANKKDLIQFYKNCPSNKSVDHIIPLNHPDVWGFHTVDNLQYMDIETNVAKSNKFDGTYDNEGWRLK